MYVCMYVCILTHQHADACESKVYPRRDARREEGPAAAVSCVSVLYGSVGGLNIHTYIHSTSFTKKLCNYIPLAVRGFPQWGQIYTMQVPCTRAGSHQRTREGRGYGSEEL